MISARPPIRQLHQIVTDDNRSDGEISMGEIENLKTSFALLRQDMQQREKNDLQFLRRLEMIDRRHDELDKKIDTLTALAAQNKGAQVMLTRIVTIIGALFGAAIGAWVQAKFSSVLANKP